MKRGDIYLLDLKEPRGSIQAGIRPVIVIQNNKGNEHSPATIVCCITSVFKKVLPTHLYIGRNGGLHHKSIVLCEQILTIDKSDLKEYIGTLKNPHLLNRLDKCLRCSLGITYYKGATNVRF